MAGRRALYLLILLSALLFQIFDDSYLAHLLFLLVLLLPALSLLLSLPALFSLRLSLRAATPAPERGGEGLLELRLSSGLGLPLTRLRGRVTFENLLTGETEQAAVNRTGWPAGGVETLSVPTAHCGRVVCRASRLRCCDYLGLFSLPLRTPAEASVLVLPLSGAPAPLPAALGEDLSGAAAAPSSGPGEDYELRAYRPGDPVRALHWKLSSKRDELIVREMSASRAPVVLVFDHFGAPERVDRLLDRLRSVSDALLLRGRPHEFLWADPADGTLRRLSVSDRQEQRRALSAVLSEPAPAEGISTAERLPPAGEDGTRFPITVEEEEDT